jgi:hypothetical protein
MADRKKQGLTSFGTFRIWLQAPVGVALSALVLSAMAKSSLHQAALPTIRYSLAEEEETFLAAH